jgi:hypothetical protein
LRSKLWPWPRRYGSLSEVPDREVKVECIVIIFTGLIAAICTARLMSLINSRTKIVLQAIAELREQR